MRAHLSTTKNDAAFDIVFSHFRLPEIYRLLFRFVATIVTAGFMSFSAFGTTSRLVLETLFGIELLLAGSKSELFAAVSASQYFICHCAYSFYYSSQVAADRRCFRSVLLTRNNNITQNTTFVNRFAIIISRYNLLVLCLMHRIILKKQSDAQKYDA